MGYPDEESWGLLAGLCVLQPWEEPVTASQPGCWMRGAVAVLPSCLELLLANRLSIKTPAQLLKCFRSLSSMSRDVRICAKIRIL